MSNHEAMLAALRWTLDNPAEWAAPSAFLYDHGRALEAMLQAKVEESAAPEIFPGTLAALAALTIRPEPVEATNSCTAELEMMTAGAEPVDAPKPEDTQIDAALAAYLKADFQWVEFRTKPLDSRHRFAMRAAILAAALGADDGR